MPDAPGPAAPPPPMMYGPPPQTPEQIAERDTAAASGLYKSEWMQPGPTPTQIKGIFARIQTMAGPTIQQAYQEVLSEARKAHADAQVLVAKYPVPDSKENNPLKLVIAVINSTDAQLVDKLETGAVFGLLMAGSMIKNSHGGTIDEASISAAVDHVYGMLRALSANPLPIPPGSAMPNYNSDGGQALMSSLAGLSAEYAVRAKILFKQYNEPATRDEVKLLLKAYFIDQLTPGWTPAPISMKCPPGQTMASDKKCYAKCVGEGYVFNDSTHTCEKDGVSTEPLQGAAAQFNSAIQLVLANFKGVTESFTEYLAGDGGMSQQEQAAAEYRAAEERAAANHDAHQEVLQAQNDGINTDAKHGNNQIMYQSSRLRQQTADMIDDFLAKAPSPRPATAGTPDAQEAKQRKKILAIQAKHLYVIQAGLLTLLLCILAFLVMPVWAAQMSVVLILATGIAAAIYLSQIQ